MLYDKEGNVERQMTRAKMQSPKSRRTFLCQIAPQMAVFALAALALPAGYAKGESAVSDPVTVDFQMSRTDRGLKVSYTVHNRGKERVYVVDQMVALKAGAYVQTPQAMVVRRGSSDKDVELLRGYVDPGHPVTLQYAPAARSLDPGKSIEGSAELPLPLAAHHPYGRPVPLTGVPKMATLQIGWVSAKAEWTRYPLATGGGLSAPTLPSVVQLQRFAAAGPKPIP